MHRLACRRLGEGMLCETATSCERRRSPVNGARSKRENNNNDNNRNKHGKSTSMSMCRATISMFLQRLDLIHSPTRNEVRRNIGSSSQFITLVVFCCHRSVLVEIDELRATNSNLLHRMRWRETAPCNSILRKRVKARG